MSSAVYYRPDLESPVACRTHAGPRSKRSASLAGIGVNTDAEESITELRRCRPRQIITDEAEMSPAQYLPVPDTGELRSICEAEREPQLRWVPGKSDPLINYNTVRGNLIIIKS